METKNVKTNRDPKPQREEQHPDEWERDLNPHRLEGQNIGPLSSERERQAPTAFARTELHEQLRGFSDDELRQIPILPEGTRLQQGATYVDMADERREPFTASGGVTAERGSLIVPKDRVPYTIWNRLIGEVKPPNR